MTISDMIHLLESNFDCKDVVPHSKLVKDMGFSSFQIMLLLCEMEELFHVQIPINKINNNITVTDLIDLSKSEVDNT